ncbi:Protein kinase domain-containing protein [Mycena venus]|uniref:Protein kinase domain-containing protein n=1 Tax=Mycena venus TaxID=2733690 RepID=A0A8H7CIW4_9AGAR|nr:Protein kinase domain-containing protein [Mycena venus]
MSKQPESEEPSATATTSSAFDAHKTRPAVKREPSPRVTSDYIAIKRQLGKGHNAVVYLIEYNTDPTPRAMKKIARNNKRTENMNRLRANNPARAGSASTPAGKPLPRTRDPALPPLVDRRGTEEAKIRKEIAIMKKCDHPNIIKFFSFIDDQMSANICLIMEYMEGGELQWQTADGGPYLTMDQTRRCTRDVVLGLQYLHLQGIIHRDIKPSNIMWTADRSHVKIGDFGVAHLVQSTSTTSDPTDPDGDLDWEVGPRHAGTPAFLAPEIAPGGEVPPASSSSSNSKAGASPNSNANKSPPSPAAVASAYSSAVTPAVDLWALGVTLFCMLFGRMPFEPAPDALSGGPVAAEASLYRAIREDPWRIPEVDVVDVDGGRERVRRERVRTLCANRVLIEDGDWREGGVLYLVGKLLEKDVKRRWGIEDVKDVPWLLDGVQRRAEWIAGTTPRITVSAADEANAILEPKFKWNLKNAMSQRIRLGRRFSNLFRTAPRDDDATGAVQSAPNVDLRAGAGRRSREKGKGKEKEKEKTKEKSRSVDTARVPLDKGGKDPKPRRGSDTLPPLPPPHSASSAGDSPTATKKSKGFFRWGKDSPTQRQHYHPSQTKSLPGSSTTTSSTTTSSSTRTGHTAHGRATLPPPSAAKRRLGIFPPAARHSTEALGSAPMVPLAARATLGMGTGLVAEQRTASMTNAVSVSRIGGEGGRGSVGESEYGSAEADGEMGKGMIVSAAQRALVGEEVTSPTRYDLDAASVGTGSGSVCSYGSGARAREGWRNVDIDAEAYRDMDRERSDRGHRDLDSTYDRDPYGDDDDEGERDPYAHENEEDEDDDGPRGNVYENTSSEDEEDVPIEIKGARRRVPLPHPVHIPPRQGNGYGQGLGSTNHDPNAEEAQPPPDSDPEDGEDGPSTTT